MERRDFIRTGLGAALASAAGPAFAQAAVFENPGEAPVLDLKGNVNHSVCKWCYPDLSVEELAAAASRMGIKSIEIVGPEAYPTLKKYGLSCAMSNGPDTGQSPIAVGWNRIEHHEFLVPGFKQRIEEVAEAGFTNLFCFSGNRDGLDDEEGLANCVTGLKQIVGHAEQHGVMLCMELLNSKVNHPDYMCDRTPWGAKLVDDIGSDHFKLLYDIYHMQIMEGDVIRTIRDYKDYFAHYHTGGNPGRNEIDDTQELNYKAIMQAIVEIGFKGFTAQEFVPTRAPLTSLGQAISICDV
jgi:hydroxypyruvate isomerase